MPIRPENRARYPADWKQISERVRQEAGNRCEWCKVSNHAVIYRGRHGDRPAWRSADWPAFVPSACAETGAEMPGTSWDDFDTSGRRVKVILTVAHLDHQPENCASENLRALCQRCHNSYDASMRSRGIARRKKAARAVDDLFGE